MKMQSKHILLYLIVCTLGLACSSRKLKKEFYNFNKPLEFNAAIFMRRTLQMAPFSGKFGDIVIQDLNSERNSI